MVQLVGRGKPGPTQLRAREMLSMADLYCTRPSRAREMRESLWEGCAWGEEWGWRGSRVFAGVEVLLRAGQCLRLRVRVGGQRPGGGTQIPGAARGAQNAGTVSTSTPRPWPWPGVWEPGMEDLTWGGCDHVHLSCLMMGAS